MVAPFEVLNPIPGSNNDLFDGEGLNLASFQGLDGIIWPQVIMKWHRYCGNLLEYQAMDDVQYSYQQFLSTAIFKPCMPALLYFCQHEREGRRWRRWWWRWWLEELIQAKEGGQKIGEVKVKFEAWLLVLSVNLWCHIFQMGDGDLTWHMQGKCTACSSDSSLSSILSNTSPALPITCSSSSSIFERTHPVDHLCLMAFVDAK